MTVDQALRKELIAHGVNPDDPKVVEFIEAWRALSDDSKRGILADAKRVGLL